MNDRYLYRAKRVDNGEWVEGYFLNVAKTNAFICTGKIKLDGALKGIIAPEMYAVDRSTICQCTGLMDKNGMLIWENDIIKYHFGNVYAPIKYGEYKSCFDSTPTGHIGFYVDWTGTTKENMRKDIGYWINMVEADVAGNIFDNPELLEVDHE